MYSSGFGQMGDPPSKATFRGHPSPARAEDGKWVAQILHSLASVSHLWVLKVTFPAFSRVFGWYSEVKSHVHG